MPKHAYHYPTAQALGKVHVKGLGATEFKTVGSGGGYGVFYCFAVQP